MVQDPVLGRQRKKGERVSRIGPRYQRTWGHAPRVRTIFGSFFRRSTQGREDKEDEEKNLSR